MVDQSRAGTGSLRRGGRLAVATALVAVMGLTAVSCGKDEAAFEKTPEGFNIEPSAEVGPHAFTPSVAAGDVKNTLGGPVEDGEVAAGADTGACNTEQFLTELQQRPEAHREWAKVLGLKESDVPAYVRGLTSTVLTTDTKVTNHGLKDGKAYPRQSVLTAGTAVLVDDATGGPVASTTSSSMPAANAPGGGVIVTRCKCGNPLLPAGDPQTTDAVTPATESPGTGTSAPGTTGSPTTAGTRSAGTTVPRSTTTAAKAASTTTKAGGPTTTDEATTTTPES